MKFVLVWQVLDFERLLQMSIHFGLHYHAAEEKKEKKPAAKKPAAKQKKPAPKKATHQVCAVGNRFRRLLLQTGRACPICARPALVKSKYCGYHQDR